MLASGEVTTRHSVAARTLIFREIRPVLVAPGPLPRENAESARNLRIQMLVLMMLRQHSFRVHKNAAPLKHGLSELRQIDIDRLPRS